MKELWDIYDKDGNKTGRLHERGIPMQKGDYHLIVQIWIKNYKKEFLISKRTSNISWPNLWQTTGGCAVAGDDSLKSALKEVNEELGIELDPNKGFLFKHYSLPHNNDEGFAFYDIWIFNHEIKIENIIFQPEETCDAIWANYEMINDLINKKEFMPIKEVYPYIDELFAYINKY